MRDPSDAEDLEQIRRCLGGHPEAFDVLFRKYRDRVFNLAYRHVYNKDDALEITQDVFLRAYQGLGDFKTGAKFFTWLYRVTVNRSIDYLRSRKRRAHREIDEHHSGEDLSREIPGHRSESPTRALELKELRGQLAEAIAGLSDKHRTVFVLHTLGQLSYKEIAETVGCSIGTVMSRLFYARKRLQDRLKNSLGESVERMPSDMVE